MEVIKPITYLESHLISTTATVPEAVYNAATSYSIGNLVSYNYKVWGSLVNTNVGNTPGVDATKWQDNGADNKHAMFDDKIYTETTRASPLTVVVKPLETFNSVAFLNLTGASLQVKVNDGVGGTEIYNTTINLDDTIILDWYMYYFEPFNFKTEVVLTDLPMYLNAALTTILTGSGTVAIGSLIYGNVYTIGGTQYGCSVSIRDYSVKTTDEFGNPTFVVRAYSKRMDAEVFVDQATLNFNYKLLAGLRAVPCVWIGSSNETYKPLIVYGYYRDFSIAIPYPTYSMCTLSIEGII